MDKAYWLARERDAIANARAATLSDVQVIHYELAQRYNIEAAKAVTGRRKFKRGLGEQLTTAFHPTRH